MQQWSSRSCPRLEHRNWNITGLNVHSSSENILLRMFMTFPNIHTRSMKNIATATFDLFFISYSWDPRSMYRNTHLNLHGIPTTRENELLSCLAMSYSYGRTLARAVQATQLSIFLCKIRLAITWKSLAVRESSFRQLTSFNVTKETL